MVNSTFRNESDVLSSDLIREAVGITRNDFGELPPLGMVTFVDTKKTRKKRDPGRCYRKAGFIPARCPAHYPEKVVDCLSCKSMTKGGLFALQYLPEFETPLVDPLPPYDAYGGRTLFDALGVS